MQDKHYDVVIIGSGAGGGTLAWRLARTGKSVLILERGEFLPREPENWDADQIFVKKRYAGEVWYDRKNRPFQPESYYCVGGNTKVYGAVLARFREEDFKDIQHPGGISPSWPLSYADYESYYCQAEQLYQVHGERNQEPTEPPASAPYPFPAIQHEPRIAQLSDALKRSGYHPSYLPMAVMLNEQQPWLSRCVRCNNCGGFPCLVHAKSDAEVIAVRPALKHGNVSLVTGAKVTKLVASPSGREVTEIVVQRGELTERYRGQIVVLAAGACNSARVLLQSRCETHPRGLANRSDQVGRNFMLHHRTAIVAFFKQPNPTRFQVTLGLNDFVRGEEGFPYPMGRLQMLGKLRSDMIRGKGFRYLPRAPLDWLAKHSIDFLLTGEDLPDQENRVSVTAQGDLKVAYTPNNTEGIRRFGKRMLEILWNLKESHELFSRPLCVQREVPLDGIGHQAGTCKMGVDPQTSVLDVHCKAHDLDNLYVVDGSFFPSIGACNPTLTIIANALRVGDHLCERLGCSDR